MQQKKLQGMAINGTVLSVNEVQDGSSDSMVEDISHELEKLRKVACALQLPNAEKINWTLLRSSTSDSASTQKRFNKLAKEKRGEDLTNFPDLQEMVQNFCYTSMVKAYSTRKYDN